MSKKIICLMVLMMFLGVASAQVVVDSVSVEPSYIEPGNDVGITVKFHEALISRELYSNPPGGAGKSPVAVENNVFYVVKIIPKDDISSNYVVIKDGEKNVGGLFKGETWSTPFKIKFMDTAPATSYAMQFQVFETNAGYAPLTLSRTYDFNVTVNGIVQFTVVSDEQANAGDKMAFKLQLANVGKGNARHVTVSLNTSSPLSVLGSNEIYVGDISDQNPRNLSFTLYVDSTAVPMAYDLPVTITYVDRNGVRQTVSKKLGVKVSGSPEIETSLDKQDELTGGLSGKVTLSVANKAFVDAKFLSLQLQDTKDYMVESKSDSYIGNLASDDFQTEDFTIKVADGVSGKIPLKVRVTYTEENNNQIHVDEPTVMVEVMSSAEYQKKHPQTNGTQTLMTILIVIPALIVAYLAIWLLLKIVGVITTFIDKRVFKR